MLEKRNVAEKERTRCDKCSAAIGSAPGQAGPILCAGCKTRDLSKQAAVAPTLKELPDQLVNEWGK